MPLAVRKPTAGELVTVAGLIMFAGLLVRDHRRLAEAERVADALESELLAIAPPNGGSCCNGDSERSGFWPTVRTESPSPA
jgi:hypothetical protein